MLETPPELWLHVQLPPGGEKDGDSQNIPPKSLHAHHFVWAHGEQMRAKSRFEQSEARVDDHRYCLTESITFPLVSLRANEAGCGWLRPADARLVIHTGAPGGFSSQPSGRLNRFPSFQRRSKCNDDFDDGLISFNHVSMRNADWEL